MIGGYDRSRFDAHDTTFALNRSATQPQARLRSIITSVADLHQAPTTWDEATEPLLFLNESANANIDRLSKHYLGNPYGNRDDPRVSVHVAIDRWHGWHNGTAVEN